MSGSASSDDTNKETDAIYLTQVLTELQEQSHNISNNKLYVEEKDQEKSDQGGDEVPINQYITVIKLHNSGESTVESEDNKKEPKESPEVESSSQKKPQNRAHKYENVIIETKTNNHVLKEETTQQSFTSTFSNITSGSVLATAGGISI